MTETDRTHAGRAPVPDADSRPFWEALAQHRIQLQQCGSCGCRRSAPMPGCPYCGAAGALDVDVDGLGVVYSWIRVHRALTPEAATEDLPYTLAAVNLDGGGRLFGRFEPPEAARIGLSVAPIFVDHPGWTELRFRPAVVEEGRSCERP